MVVQHENLSTACSAAKAAISLEHFCPILSMAPVSAIEKMVAGLS
jgi:hypothetical protein